MAFRTTIASFLSLSVLWANPVSAFSEGPWCPPDMEFQWKSGIDFRYFSDINSNGSSVSYHDHVVRLFTELEIASMDEYCLGFQVSGANTKRVGFDIESGKARFSYLWLDDICGDCVSLSTTFDFQANTRFCLRDIALELLAPFEYSAFVSVGKELSCGEEWERRIWMDFGLGMGSKGSPWLFSKAGVARKCTKYLVYAHALFAMGFGQHDLAEFLDEPFPGYAEIKFRNADAVFGISRLYQDYSQLSLELSYRFYSYNMPKDVWGLTVTYLYPFGP